MFSRWWFFDKVTPRYVRLTVALGAQGASCFARVRYLMVPRGEWKEKGGLANLGRR